MSGRSWTTVRGSQRADIRKACIYSRNFERESDYDQFVGAVLTSANHRRTARLAEELAVMRLLPPTRLSEYEEVYCTVGCGSIVRVKKVGYSVPARLIGQKVKVEVHEQELKLFSGGSFCWSCPGAAATAGWC